MLVLALFLVLCCSAFLLFLECVHLFVRFSFSIPSQEIGLGNVSEMMYFVLSGT